MRVSDQRHSVSHMSYEPVHYVIKIYRHQRLMRLMSKSVDCHQAPWAIQQTANTQSNCPILQIIPIQSVGNTNLRTGKPWYSCSNNLKKARAAILILGNYDLQDRFKSLKDEVKTITPSVICSVREGDSYSPAFLKYFSFQLTPPINPTIMTSRKVCVSFFFRVSQH